MNHRETARRAQILERQFEFASPLRRQQMRREVSQCIHDFRVFNQSVPNSLLRVKTAIEAEDYEDMFDNMPV